MRRLVVMVSVGVAIALTVLAGVRGSDRALAQGNSQAAHACQQGGYLDYVRGSDLTVFKNAGDCVAYATKPGSVLVPACTASPAESIGCITFSNLTLPDTSAAITLKGVISFSTCLTLGTGGDPCGPRPASGVGTYSISGPTPSTGTFQVTLLQSQYYLGPDPAALVSCHDAEARQLNFLVTLTPTGETPTAWELYVRDVPTDASLNIYALFSGGPAGFSLGPAPAGLLTC